MGFLVSGNFHHRWFDFIFNSKNRSILVDTKYYKNLLNVHIFILNYHSQYLRRIICTSTITNSIIEKFQAKKLRIHFSVLFWISTCYDYSSLDLKSNIFSMNNMMDCWDSEIKIKFVNFLHEEYKTFIIILYDYTYILWIKFDSLSSFCVFHV